MKTNKDNQQKANADEYGLSRIIDEENEKRYKEFAEKWGDIELSYPEERWMDAVGEYFMNSNMTAVANAARELGISYEEMEKIMWERVDW